MNKDPKEKEILKHFLEYKMTIWRTAKILGVSRERVQKVLKNNKVKPRSGRCVEYLKYTLDHDFFSKIDTEEKAYLLGLLYADGCVCKDNNTVNLVSNDLKLIVYFHTAIKITKQIYKNPSHKNAYTLYFCSPKMKKDLIKLGCFPQKSLTLKYPKSGLIPKKYKRDFLRGVFDGDGCITGRGSNTQVYFLGTLNLIKGIKKELERYSITFNKIQKNSNIFRLRTTNRSSIRNLGKLLYSHQPKMFLNRKRERFDFAKI